MGIEANTAMARVCRIERVCAPQVELSRRRPTWPVFTAQLLQVHSLSHSGPEDGNVKWAPERCSSSRGCHFPHSPSPPGLPRARCLIGHLSDPFLCDPMAFEDVKSQPWACRPACIEGLWLVGTVPGARMQRCLGPRFCARRAQSGEGTGTVTRGYSDGLRGVRAFGEQPERARASGKPHRGDDSVWEEV